MTPENRRKQGSLAARLRANYKWRAAHTEEVLGYYREYRRRQREADVKWLEDVIDHTVALLGGSRHDT